MHFRGPLIVLLLRLGVVALIYSLQRLFFWWLNLEAFPHAPFSAFLGGVRFDLSAIAWLNLPWVLLILINPAPLGRFRIVQKIVFHLVNIVGFFFNCVDMAYYAFTLKRSTVDLFTIAGGGNDLQHLMPVFLRDYWYVVVIFLASIALAEWGYRRAGRKSPFEPFTVMHRAGWRVAAILLMLLGARGGVQLIPIVVLDAGRHAPPAYMPLVLNSPFTVMKSIGKPMVQERNFMSQAEADRLWPVVQQVGDTSVATGRPNVVVILLESFSAQYSGVLAGGPGYMPFLDSLMGQGLNFTHAFANGRRSIDGIPAVLASMPKLMEEAFLTSAYAQAPFTSLAGVLDAEGYRSVFFHGGHNGTMGFDGFTQAAGFQEYIGRDQYPDPADDDKVWGILDRPFLQYVAKQLNERPQPFLGCVFTLTSHHPYDLPPEDAKKFAGGTLPIHATLRYTDDAVRQFFATARTMPWYANTLFVITADHTADLERKGELSGNAFDHWIPLCYFMPSAIAPRTSDRVTQQIDIMPTVLDLIGYRKPFFSFGHSAVRETSPQAAFSSANGLYMIVGPNGQLRSDGDTILWVSGIDSHMIANDPVPDPATQAAMLRKLQAAVQQFSGHLLRNDLVVPATP